MLVTLGIGGTLALGQGTASADSLIHPDWGMSCQIAKPYPNAAFSYQLARPSSRIVNGNRTVENPISWDQI